MKAVRHLADAGTLKMTYSKSDSCSRSYFLTYKPQMPGSWLMHLAGSVADLKSRMQVVGRMFLRLRRIRKKRYATRPGGWQGVSVIVSGILFRKLRMNECLKFSN